MFNFLKQRIIKWCLNERETTIGELHNISNPRDCKIYDEATNQLKFIEQTSPTNFLVKTPDGFSRIKHSHKTVKYLTWTVITESKQIQGADKHIVITSDNKERFIKDLQPGDLIKTNDGNERVISISSSKQMQSMYDLELDDENHVYYTNGILSHNSTISAMFLLWYASFKKDKQILIASNKNSGAMEMVHRIRYAYENLPMWLKPGVQEDGWNKHTVAFDNDSRISSTATSEDSGRGQSISLLYLDEFAFVAPTIQEEFWTSIAPTLATGGSCIISSTPNGDNNLFANIWRSANVGTRSGHAAHNMYFNPTHVRWDEPPGRDEKFKQSEIDKIGELKWLQEYECEFLSSDPLLIDSTILATLTTRMDRGNYQKEELNDFTFWERIQPNTTYLMGIDPSGGTGNDFSVIELFEFPSIRQVAEYRANTTSSNELYKKAKWLLKNIESLNSSCYFSVENNGVGDGFIALYVNDETSLLRSEMISGEDSKKMGFNTNVKTKIKACLNFKEIVESDKIQIKSKVLLTELKSFVKKRGSYEAQRGSTDDCIAACLIIVRIIEEMASFDDDAFNRLYGIADDNTPFFDDSDDFDDGDALDEDPLPILI